MNPYALGWDNHRKFSKVSLMEQTPDGEIRAVRAGAAGTRRQTGHARLVVASGPGNPRGPGGHLRLAVGGRSAGGIGPSRPSGPSAGDPRPGQARGQDRPLRQRSAGKVSAPRHLAGKLPRAAGSPPATGTDPLPHGAVGVANRREEPCPSRPAPPRHPARLQRPVRQGRPTLFGGLGFAGRFAASPARMPRNCSIR